MTGYGCEKERAEDLYARVYCLSAETHPVDDNE